MKASQEEKIKSLETVTTDLLAPYSLLLNDNLYLTWCLIFNHSSRIFLKYKCESFTFKPTVLQKYMIHVDVN